MLHKLLSPRYTGTPGKPLTCARRKKRKRGMMSDEEEETKTINLGDFSFNRAKEILKDYKGSLSDAVIEERRNNSNYNL
jgi:hypothetical protein